MTDFALHPLTRDLILPLRPVTGAEEVAQRIGIRLRTWLSEWFLDTSHGVPYLGGVLGKQPRREMVEATLRAQILDVAGVRSLVSFSLEIDPRTRSARFSFVADTAEGLAKGTLAAEGGAVFQPRPLPPPPPIFYPQPGAGTGTDPGTGTPPPLSTVLLTDGGIEITDDNLVPITL